MEAAAHFNDSDFSRKADRPSLFSCLRDGLNRFFNVEKQSKKREVIPIYKAGVPDRELNVAERAIRRARTWDELYDAVKVISQVPSSGGGNLSAEDIQRRIYNAYYSEDPQAQSKLIPRTYGLRNKYIQLLKRVFEERPIHKSVEELALWGATGAVRLKDPEKYHSKSVEKAMKKIIAVMETRGITIQTHKLEVAKIAAKVVNEIMPYDFVGLEAGHVGADQAADVTEIVEKYEAGVCRHQAPFLVAVLKKLGFDAYQVYHMYGKVDFAHTLAYIADSEVAAFLNPGEMNGKWTLIPYHLYGQQNRASKYGAAHSFSFRTPLNKWKPFAYRL